MLKDIAMIRYAHTPKKCIFDLNSTATYAEGVLTFQVEQLLAKQLIRSVGG